MNRHELKALNAELVDLLTLLRDLIDSQLDELVAAEDDDAMGDDAEDAGGDGDDAEDDGVDDDPALDESDEG